MNYSGDKRQVDRLFMDILRANQNGNIVVVSFHHADSNPDLNEEARQLGLEPRYVYRVTQVADLGQGRQIVRVKNRSGQQSETHKCHVHGGSDAPTAHV